METRNTHGDAKQRVGGDCLGGRYLVRLLGGKSGFKTARDLTQFIVGLAIDLSHIFTTPADHLDWKLLIFGAGIAGLPIVQRQDEKKKE